MAGELNVSRYDNNEILHGDDINYAETREYENLTSILKNLAFSVKDVIIQGGIVKERGTPSMNVDIEPILAFCVSTGKFAYYGSDSGPISVTSGGGSNRYDTLEIQLKEVTFDEVQRAYKDPNTGDITYQNWKTKKHYELEAQVLVGGASAPNHTAGWIKIAEIFVEAGESTSILDADIENVSAGYDTETNSAWTAETDATFRVKALTEVKALFRSKHKESGDHEDDVIRDAHVDWGAGAGEVDADLMPLGTNIVHAPTGGTDASLTSGSTARQAVQKILDLLIDLSGVQNDALDSRHIAADAIDEEHINWGIGAGDVDGDLMPIGTAISTTEVNIANTVSVRDALNTLAEALNRPVGTIWMFDGSGWVDNTTIPGWYACIAANAGQGCPDMVDRFAMGKVVVGSGSTGGSNVLIDHTHSCGNQSPTNHTHAMGSHGHDFRYKTDKLGVNNGAYLGNVGLGYHSGYDFTISSSVKSESLGNTENQSASHSHSIGSGSAPGSTNSRPQYYSMVYIRKCA